MLLAIVLIEFIARVISDLVKVCTIQIRLQVAFGIMQCFCVALCPLYHQYIAG